jgi:hypothetical protein
LSRSRFATFAPDCLRCGDCAIGGQALPGGTNLFSGHPEWKKPARGGFDLRSSDLQTHRTAFRLATHTEIRYMRFMKVRHESHGAYLSA